MYHLPPVRQVHSEVSLTASLAHFQRRIRVCLEVHAQRAPLRCERLLDTVCEFERHGYGLHMRMPTPSAKPCDLEERSRGVVFRE
jgi:hypothetical protein